MGVRSLLAQGQTLKAAAGHPRSAIDHHVILSMAFDILSRLGKQAGGIIIIFIAAFNCRQKLRLSDPSPRRGAICFRLGAARSPADVEKQ